MKGVKKQHLPEKPCATCGRHFVLAHFRVR